MKGSNIFTIIIAVFVAAVLILYLVSFQVRETEVAVKTTFEKIPAGAAALSAGLHWKLPWPVQDVVRYDKRLRVYEDSLDEIQTKDGKPVLMSCYAGWRITDAATFLAKVGDEEKAADKIGKIVRDQKGSVLGGHSFSDLVSLRSADGGSAPKFGEIEKGILDNVREKLGVLYGIDVVIVGIKRLELPGTITVDVFKRMEAERKRLAEQYRSEGESEAMEIRADADRVRAETLAKAEGAATVIRGAADAAAAQYYQVFAQNPDLAVFLRKISALQKSLEKRSTIVLSGSSPPYDLLENAGADIDKIKTQGEK